MSDADIARRALPLIRLTLRAGIEGARASHAETKEAGKRGAADLKKIVSAFLSQPERAR